MLTSSKRKHNTLTIEKKIEIINRLSKGESGSSLAKIYNIGKATISAIKNKKADITAYASKLDSSDGSCKKRKTMKMAKDSALEDAMFLWFTQTRSLGKPISGPLLCLKALEMNAKLNGPEDFMASTGWLKNFKSRHNIRELQNEGEILSCDFLAAESFKKRFLNLMQEGYSTENIYNADETGLFWRTLPSKSLASMRRAAAPGLKHSKERVTVLVCANASGTHALPLFVIGRSKNPHCFKNVYGLPVGYAAQKNAWMDSNIFYEWYTKYFVSEVTKHQKSQKRNGKVLLLLDNAPCHPSCELLNAFHDQFRVEYMPANATATIQPMNQGVIEKLKRIYRKLVLRRLLLAENDEESVIQFSEELNLKDSCYVLAEAWAQVSVKNLKNGWKKLLSIEETDFNEEDNGIESDLTDVVQELKGFENCDESDIEDWIQTDSDDMGFKIFTDEEIVASVTNASNERADELDDNDGNSNIKEEYSKGPTHSDAFAAAETLMNWYEKQTECCTTQLLLLKRIRDLAAYKKRSSTVLDELP